MRYTSDLSDAQWQHIEYCFPEPSKLGRPRKHSLRELVNAIFYFNKTGCQWRQLPKDFAPWKTVYTYFRIWTNSQLIKRIHDHLREQVRQVEGRNPEPSAAIIDSQTCKSTEMSNERGYDAGKKINGRKRHILVDTMGLLLQVLVLPANIQDRDGARPLISKFYSRKGARSVKHIWADGGYTGSLIGWCQETFKCTMEIVKRPELHKFKVMPRRWVVERTFGWLGRYRRLSKDYERCATTGEAVIHLAMIRLMLNRLGK